MGEMPDKKWLAEAIAQHVRDFPPLPPLEATMEVYLEEAVTIAANITKSRLGMLRELFPGMSDDNILNELVDEILSRFGMI